MTVTESTLVKEIEKLRGLRLLIILLSFAIALLLINHGQTRTAILIVGAAFLLGGVGYLLAEKNAINSMSKKTGKSPTELRQELRKGLSLKKYRS